MSSYHHGWGHPWRVAGTGRHGYGYGSSFEHPRQPAQPVGDRPPHLWCLEVTVSNHGHACWVTIVQLFTKTYLPEPFGRSQRFDQFTLTRNNFFHCQHVSGRAPDLLSPPFLRLSNGFKGPKSDSFHLLPVAGICTPTGKLTGNPHPRHGSGSTAGAGAGRRRLTRGRPVVITKHVTEDTRNQPQGHEEPTTVQTLSSTAYHRGHEEPTAGYVTARSTNFLGTDTLRTSL
ncbi:hypothetical protein B0H13DRAFT_2552171 [Mycena leptocephala]|nr:hypothetical protein B0H13DRAFT_2552171 [Mycena leptocephala]